MLNVRVYLKSGSVMQFICEDILLNISDVTGKIIGYKIIHNNSKERGLYIDVDNIEGVVIEDI